MAVEPYLASWTRGTPGTIVVTDPEYGAIGDGVHDDTAAIQAAIDAASSSQSVMFPPGIFLITSTINLDIAIRLVGSGRTVSTIKWGGGTNYSAMINVTGPSGSVLVGVGVCDLGFDGQDASNGPTALFLGSNQTNGTFERLLVNNVNIGIDMNNQSYGHAIRDFYVGGFYSYAIRSQGDSEQLTIDNAWIIYGNSGTSTGILLNQAVSAVISRATIQACNAGMEILGCKGIRITNPHFESIAADAIKLSGASTYNNDGIAIDTSYFYEVGTPIHLIRNSTQGTTNRHVDITEGIIGTVTGSNAVIYCDHAGGTPVEVLTVKNVRWEASATQSVPLLSGIMPAQLLGSDAAFPTNEWTGSFTTTSTSLVSSGFGIQSLFPASPQIRLTGVITASNDTAGSGVTLAIYKSTTADIPTAGSAPNAGDSAIFQTTVMSAAANQNQAVPYDIPIDITFSGSGSYYAFYVCVAATANTAMLVSGSWQTYMIYRGN